MPLRAAHNRSTARFRRVGDRPHARSYHTARPCIRLAADGRAAPMGGRRRDLNPADAFNFSMAEASTLRYVVVA